VSGNDVSERESELSEMEPESGPVAAVDLVCPACGAEVYAEDQFCEACGVSLVAGAAGTEAGDETVIKTGAEPAAFAAGACQGCGGAAFSDGYCDQCGRLAPDPRDHIEQDLGLVAGVTDRGLRHSRNEDAMALAVLSDRSGTDSGSGPASIVVACDGVSTSPNPHIASLVAAELIRDRLAEDLGRGRPAEPAMTEAIAAAQRAVTALSENPTEPSNSPCATVVAVAVEPGLVTVGWVGDSRVYWLSRTAAESRRLTADDSWAGMMISQGIMAEADAYKSPHAHTIVRWLGADAPDEPAHVLQFVPEGPGLILACSDGLWNYVPDAAKLAELAVPTEAGGAWGGLQSAANGLCAVALEGGGHDNITVVLAAYPPVVAGPSQLASTIPLERVEAPGEDAGSDTADHGGDNANSEQSHYEGSGL
jgi:serine/threonine protein phosphatase PrpC